MQITTQLLALLAAILFVLSMCSVEARPQRHHKRAITPDYEYRNTEDYTDGIFIDAVPIRTTVDPKNSRPHQKTNRFPKLRKFFAESERFFH